MGGYDGEDCPPDASALPTGETLAFLEPYLAGSGMRVLEVGCGDGELAAELVGRGHHVVALDSKPEAVQLACKRGVDARQARFPGELGGLEGGGFDLVFFGRLLHHLEDLSASLGIASELLRPGGLLVIEDYAWEAVDEATAQWALGWLRFARKLGSVPDGEWAFDLDPLSAWLLNTRDQGLHSSASMQAAIAENFELDLVLRAPYAYRWIAKYFSGQAGAASVTRVLLQTERQQISLGEIVPIGWRAVARRI